MNHHLRWVHGPLVVCGPPVENHWFRGKLLQIQKIVLSNPLFVKYEYCWLSINDWLPMIDIYYTAINLVPSDVFFSSSFQHRYFGNPTFIVGPHDCIQYNIVSSKYRICNVIKKKKKLKISFLHANFIPDPC